MHPGATASLETAEDVNRNGGRVWMGGSCESWGEARVLTWGREERERGADQYLKQTEKVKSAGLGD